MNVMSNPSFIEGADFNLSLISSVGDALQSGVYKLHSEFASVINFESSGNIVSIVVSKIGNGPNNIVVNALPKKVSELEIKKNVLVLGTQEMDLTNIFHYVSSFVVLCGLKAEKCMQAKLLPRIKNNLDFLENNVWRLSSEANVVCLFAPTGVNKSGSKFMDNITDRLKHGVSLFAAGDLENGVQILRGTGLGLTPSGDDFLVGYLAALSTLEVITKISTWEKRQIVYKAALGGNLLSNSFLTDAFLGRFTQTFSDFLQEFYFGNNKELEVSVKKVIDYGDTSGSDTLTGFIFGISKEKVLWQ